MIPKNTDLEKTPIFVRGSAVNVMFYSFMLYLSDKS